MNLVLDSSVTMRWFFGDSKPQELVYAGKVLDAMRSASAIAPVTWGWKSQTLPPGRKPKAW